MTSMATPAKRTPTPGAAKKTPAAKAPARKAVKAPAAKAAPPPRVAPAQTPPPADAPPPTPPGWYPTPAPGMSEEAYKRYWDGQGWLGTAVPAELVPTTDEPAPPPPAAAESGDTLVIEPIVFRGRSMNVNPLDAGKLGVWQIICEEFAARSDGPPAGASPAMIQAHTEKMARLLKQGIKVIRSVLADDADRDWLVDELMESDLTLQAATEIVTLAVAAFVAAKQREGQPVRSSGPPPRVRRRS